MQSNPGQPDGSTVLARIAVHLPESLWLRQGEDLQPFAEDFAEERVVVSPPLQSSFEVHPDADGRFNVTDIYRMLMPVAPPRVYPFVRMDGRYVTHANLLQIDFVRACFHRETGEPDDPPRKTIEGVVANVVARLRYTIGAPTFREFRLLETFWTVRYLNDDATDLPEVKGLVRGRVHAPFAFRFTGLDASSWNGVERLALDFQPQVWERLYLDALFLLPEVSPALTLAIAAIETAANQMIHDQLPGRDADAKALISGNGLAQRLDVVALQLAGVSLKDQAGLWAAFHRLKRARNAAVHEGKPIVDGIAVDDHLAQKMILNIRPVLDWIEFLMNTTHRNHRDPREPKWEWHIPVESGRAQE